MVSNKAAGMEGALASLTKKPSSFSNNTPRYIRARLLHPRNKKPATNAPTEQPVARSAISGKVALGPWRPFGADAAGEPSSPVFGDTKGRVFGDLGGARAADLLSSGLPLPDDPASALVAGSVGTASPPAPTARARRAQLKELTMVHGKGLGKRTAQDVPAKKASAGRRRMHGIQQPTRGMA